MQAGAESPRSVRTVERKVDPLAAVTGSHMPRVRSGTPSCGLPRGQRSADVKRMRVTGDEGADMTSMRVVALRTLTTGALI